MFFLIRTAFWISLLLLVLPFGGALKSDGPGAKDRASIDAMAALAAAGATVADMGSFCGRQREACAVGGQALKLVGERAGAATALVQDYLATDAKTPGAPKASDASKASEASRVSEASKGPDTSKSLDRVKTSDVSRPLRDVRPVVTGSTAGGRQTLSPSDRKPGWRGPAA